MTAVSSISILFSHKGNTGASPSFFMFYFPYWALFIKGTRAGIILYIFYRERRWKTRWTISTRLPWWLSQESAYNAGDSDQSLDWKDPWRREWQSIPVFLPGRVSWTEEPGGLQFMGLQRAGHNWENNTLTNNSYNHGENRRVKTKVYMYRYENMNVCKT